MTEKRETRPVPEAPEAPVAAGDSADPEDSAGPGDSAALAARELRAVFSRLRRTLREADGTGDLTPSQTAVLSRLINDGPASASALAAAERVRPQSMAASLAALEQHGLIGRRPDPEDGRRLLVSLTEAGLARIADSRQAREEWLARALEEQYDEAERTTVLAALALIDRLNRR
ncbi:MarR family transcriptional regulator [Kitasatospora sp. NPDC096140]|uniref:MarR family winged helix-turn-helix transcriptional regulator n=1 Tax=Kitasatospora sp. NPDC096140 TaxID=3155425 RepID=UPI00332701C0